MFTAPSSLSSAASSIVSGLPAIALSDVKRPWPSEVPPPTERRLIAATTSSLHVARPEHGDGAVAERDDADLDRPRLLLDEARCAAAFAASIRVGSRSSARMLFETSKARITVPSRSGNATLTVGRASAKQTSASAAAKSANGTWRRQRTRRLDAVGTSPSAASRRHALGAPPERPPVGEHERRDAARARAASTATRATSAAPPPFARLDDPDERLDEVVLGRDLVDVDAGAERQPRAAPPRGPRRPRAGGGGTRRRSSRPRAARRSRRPRPRSRRRRAARTHEGRAGGWRRPRDARSAAAGAAPSPAR